PYRPFNIADRLSACDRVGAVDIHRAAAADLLATRSSEHEGGIDPVLDEKKEHPRPWGRIRRDRRDRCRSGDPRADRDRTDISRTLCPAGRLRAPAKTCPYQSWSFSAAQHSAEELSCPRPRLAVFHTLAVNWPNSCMTPQSTPISSRQSRGDGLHATVAGPTIRPCNRFPTRESISGYDLISC